MYLYNLLKKHNTKIIITFTFLLTTIFSLSVEAQTDESKIVFSGHKANSGQVLLQDKQSNLTQLILKKTVSVEANNAALLSILEDVSKQAGLKLSYERHNIPEGLKKSMKLEKVSLAKAIWKILEGTDLRFGISPSNHLVIFKHVESNLKNEIQAQIDIEGTVVDSETGDALPGVNIGVKGTNIGTSTNSAGYFELTISSVSDTLVFSFVGYEQLEVPVGDQTEFSIELTPEAIVGEDLVVVGYGRQESRDITGSVSSISSENIDDLPVISSFEQALKGQISGVQVFQNTGSPSSGVTIKIRGSKSISAGNEPLYVIDGHPITGGSGGTGNIPGGGNPMNNINPRDIESIDVLKDASATAIYGSQGANGVVLITTKSGSSGNNIVTLDVSTGWQTATRKIPRLGPDEFAEYHIESRYNGWIRDGGSPDVPNGQRGRFNVPDIYFDEFQWNRTDWQDVVLRTGMVSNYNLTTSGGTDNVRYSVSGGYTENQGIIIETSMQRYTFRANVDATVNDKLDIGFRLNPSYAIHDQANTEGHFRQSILGMALSNPPIVGPYQEDGSYTNINAMRGADGIGGLGAIDNPVTHAKENQFDLENGRIIGSFYAEYDIRDDLAFRSSIGIDINNNRTNVFLSSKTGRNGSTPPTIPEGSTTSSQKLNWLNENLLTYTKSLSQKHKITAILGNSIQKNDYRNIRVDGTQFPSDNVPYLNAAGEILFGTAVRNQWTMLSFYSRINYDYDSKYLFTGTIRRDGSSRFGDENKFGTFPSAAVAWRMSEENFMQNIDLINDWKWRLSYGVSGNNDIGDYTHIPSVSYSGYVLGDNQNQVNAIHPNSLANQNITWETNRSYNMGLDIGLFDNRLQLVADAYHSVTDGLLLNVNIPAVSGYTSTLENIGEVQNRGIEFAVNSINTTGLFFWSSSFNISFNRNKVIALGGSAGDFISSGVSRTEIGKPMGLFYARVTDGIFNSQEEIDNHPPQDNSPGVGDRRFADVNGDGVVNNEDQDFIGDPHPDFVFGISNNFSYKNFDLNVLINGSYGNDIFYKYAVGANLNGNLNQDADVIANRWRSPEEPGSGNIPAAVNGFSILADANSDFHIKDGSYIRLTNISLTYNISSAFVNNFGFQNARVTLSGQNLLTLTKYPGYDPEIASSGGNPVSFGVDGGIYPLARVVTAGVSISF